jgi:glucose/arabinose dehydrogenase
VIYLRTTLEGKSFMLANKQNRTGFIYTSLRTGANVVALLMVLIVVVACSAPGTTATSAAPTATPTSAPATPTSVPPTPTPTPHAPVEVQTKVLVTGLQIPWGLAFLPDGRALVGERASGRLLAITTAGKVEQIQRLPSRSIGEGGLLGIAVSPNYATDGWVYAYYSTQNDNRIVRFHLKQAPQPLLTGIPVSTNHNGGRLAFGPDGMLYAGTGDATVRGNSQDRGSLAGKILRLKPDGGIPGDNPFPNSYVYSYGHRNVQGLTWDASGQLFASEFGQNTYDEVNKIEAGGNYGWPIVEGKGNDKRFINPITTFTTAEASPSGATFLNNGAIPQWEGTLFVAALRGTRLWHLTLNTDGTLQKREALLQGQFGRLRLVTQAPDGSLWLLTSNRDGRGNPVASDDRIIRLGP